MFVYFLENDVKNGEFNITPYGTSRICIPRLDRASIWFETPPLPPRQESNLSEPARNRVNTW